MFTAVLQMNLKDDGSWDFLPQDLWIELLNSFVLLNCSSIGFSGIEKNEDLTRIECFSDWQPPYLGSGNVSISWQSESSNPVIKDNQFALFEYSEEVNDRLSRIDNTAWKVYDEEYPVDELYFFQDNRVLVIAVPFEGSILFCDLSDQQKESLMQVDGRISNNIHQMTDRQILSKITD